MIDTKIYLFLGLTNFQVESRINELHQNEYFLLLLLKYLYNMFICKLVINIDNIISIQ